MDRLGGSWLVASLAVMLCICGTGVRASEEGALFSLQPVTYDPAVPASQAYFILDARPGETLTSAVRITNGGTSAGAVHLYPVDGTTGNTSGTVFLAEQEQRRDAGAWIALGETTLTLAVGETRVVPFTVAIPADPRPGQHVGGIVAENAAPQTALGTDTVNINIRHRNIIAVQVNLAGPVVEHIAVTGVVPGGEQGYQSLALGLQNDGTVMLKPSGTLEVRDTQGAILQHRSFTLDTFLPQTAIAYPVAVQGQALGPGDYDATLVLAYGNNGETRYAGRFRITPAQIQVTFQGSQPLAAPVPIGQTATVGNPLSGGLPAGNATTLTPAAASPPAEIAISAGVGVLLLSLVALGVFAMRQRWS